MKKRSLLVFLITTLLIILPFVFTGCMPTKAKYTVEYYLQNIENNEFTLDTTHTYTAQGLIDGSAVENPKTIEGFTFTNNNSILQGMVTKDGNLTLKLYYTRNTFTLSTNDTSAGSISKSGTIKYGESITCTATPKQCYDFIGWYSGETLLSTENTYTFTAIQDIVAKFEVKPELSNFTFTVTENSFVITGIKDENATEVIIPNGVTSIGSSAFEDCDSLTSVTIGDSVTSIGSSAFYSCDSLTSVTIGDSVTSIGSSAFYSCDSLASIEIPDSVTSIGFGAFYNTSYSNNTSNWENNVLYIGKYLIGAKYLIEECEIKEGTLVIADYAFSGCNKLTSITIGDSVTSIGSSAFSDCNKLTSITIGDSVTSIGNSAFSNCTSLTNIRIPSSVTSIGSNAFRYCSSLARIIIPKNVQSVGGMVFSDCNWCITIYCEAESQPSGWDTNWKISSTYQPRVFWGLKRDGVTDDGLFWIKNTNDNTVRIVCYIGNDTTLTIPSTIEGYSVTSIGSSAFYNCDSLTSIVIPDGVTSIGSNAFYNCYSLTTINFNGAKAQWNKITKGNSWKYNVKATYVTCSDGTVNL